MMNDKIRSKNILKSNKKGWYVSNGGVSILHMTSMCIGHALRKCNVLWVDFSKNIYQEPNRVARAVASIEGLAC